MTSCTVYHLDGERTLRGGERQLLYLAAALERRGHRNVVVCRKGSLLDAEASRLGLKTAHLPFLTEWDPLSAMMLRIMAGRSVNPVVHSHTAHTAALAALACGRAIPRVAHRRVDFELHGAASRSMKYDQAGAVVAVSQAVKGVLTGCGMEAARIAVVPDAVPFGRQECAWAGLAGHGLSPATPESRASERSRIAAKFGVEPESPWVGNLAALVPHKDHDTLVAAAYIAARKRPDLRFLIAGDGPLAESLTGQIERMDLRGKVRLLGRVEDGPAFLRSLDVLAHSSWGEGMGSVLLEASACRIPIAATTAGGIPELVEDGRTGLLVPPRDPEALAGAVLRLVGDRGLAAALATAASARVPQFSMTAMAEKMEAIYGRIAR
ncbi:MAG: glycosyltransferase [Elusimicrobia bacterium]|nr:glycosyltransferase [Elusimicrobiota bacterium]